MFNNVMIDVSIGLVFIYLLYSLLATTIKEFIATLFDYRARMLERGLEQMLDGNNTSYYWWNRLLDTIIPKNKEKATGKFYRKTHSFTNEISCHPLYVRAAENSKFSRKPSYLPADMFSDILIDVLKEKNKPALLKDISSNLIKRANDPEDPLNKNLEKILEIYLDQANGDLQRFKLIIENWYNDMMDRVGGWYKRQANRILIVIGLFLAVIFNVSTIEIVDKLSTDKNAREALVQNASAYIKAHSDKLSGNTNPSTNVFIGNDSIGVKKDTSEKKLNINKKDLGDNGSLAKTGNLKDTTRGKPDHLATLSSAAKSDTGMQAMKNAINNIEILYKDEIINNNSIVGLGWGDFGFSKKKDYQEWVKNGKSGKKPEKPDPLDKLGYVFCQLWSWKKILGLLITALAISLGAPFWFDLLNKFINLRVSGAKPNEKSSTPVSKTALLNQKPDPLAKG